MLHADANWSAAGNRDMCFLSPAAPVSFHHPIFSPFPPAPPSAWCPCGPAPSPLTTKSSHPLLSLLKRQGEGERKSSECVCVSVFVGAKCHRHTSEARLCLCVWSLKSVCLLCPGADFFFFFKSDVQGNG